MLIGRLSIHLHKVGRALSAIGQAIWANAETVGKTLATVVTALGGLALIISTAIGKAIIDSMETVTEEPALCD